MPNVFIPAALTAAKVLACLAEPTRLLIVAQLLSGPKHVTQLSKNLSIPMGNVSHHLGFLKSAGLVRIEKTGRLSIYSLTAEAVDPSSGVFDLGCCEFRFKKD